MLLSILIEACLKSSHSTIYKAFFFFLHEYAYISFHPFKNDKQAMLPTDEETNTGLKHQLFEIHKSLLA